MAVQIQPAKPAEQFNGLVAIEADILKADPHEKIVAIVTYERVKRVEDEANDDYYPVLKVKHIEPILGNLTEEALALQLRAYQARTGENELDFTAVASDDTDGEDGE
jgi:hypothetical protein